MDWLRYPLSGETPARTLAVGAALSALGVLILPALVVTGYYGRVLDRSSRGADAPSFESVGDLLASGFRTWAVLAGYLLVGVVAVAVLGVITLVLGGANTGLGAAFGALVIGALLVTAVGLLAFPAWYFVPAALTRVAREQSIRAGFELRAVWRVISDRRYFARWLAGFGAFAGGSVGYAGLSALDVGVPLVGHVLGTGLNFYSGVVAVHLWGRGYAAASDESAVADSPATDSPAADSAPDSTADRADDREPGRSAEWGADAARWRERRREGGE
ncbi:DUF4013 domain-containing protein [Halorussus gelatinilyticus]|uniref:DUF4013 domain-containing protein n=1 Tax=Halorussus gelatinilyticus TaxID=2937524 RepID=A0A8U0IIP2_9EURY|nr:DUF4013 domain-containing protein [Halorussus gelatinilyticus]UPW00658.1 DUF4013 domain-containing protein [Halorussus gelatinilyticus]